MTGICFHCGKNIKCECDDLDMPDGAVVFDGGDNFGSAIYDALMDGIMARLLICDDCLTKNRARIYEMKRFGNGGLAAGRGSDE